MNRYTLQFIIAIFMISRVIALNAPDTKPESPDGDGNTLKESFDPTKAQIPNDKVPKDWYHIAGSYRIHQTTWDNGRPSWATLWKPELSENEINVYLWPPQYCHAVYICFVPQFTYNAVSFLSIRDETCVKNSIKYYPFIQKIVLTGPDGDTDEKYFADNQLVFEKKNDTHFALSSLYAEKPMTYNFRAELEEVVEDINLANLDWLILTNSRMCQVNIPGNQFYPLLNPKVLKDSEKANLPKLLSHVKSEGVYSDLVMTGGKPKSVDLLPILKFGKFQPATGAVIKRCLNYKKGGFGSKSKNKREISTFVSARSYEVVQDNTETSTSGFIRQFEMGFKNCHWVRIGFHETANTAADYMTQFQLDSTLDIFFNEGFYVNPNTDEAQPLPGHHEITSIQFIGHVRTDTPSEVVEMRFGDKRGAKVYSQFFKLPVFFKTLFRMHVIRSPFCETDLKPKSVATSKKTSLENPTKLIFKSCKYTELK